MSRFVLSAAQVGRWLITVLANCDDNGKSIFMNYSFTHTWRGKGFVNVERESDINPDEVQIVHDSAGQHPPRPSYLPQVSCVSDGSRLQFVQEQRDSLKRANPGSLGDPLGCTDPVSQTRNRTGAQTHLNTHTEPILNTVY